MVWQWEADLVSELASALSLQVHQIQMLTLRESYSDAVIQLELSNLDQPHQMVTALRTQVSGARCLALALSLLDADHSGRLDPPQLASDALRCC